MTLHLLKLSVGAESVEDLAAWQKNRLAERKRARKPAELLHVTRQTPKRADEILDGGSLYWVVKGQIAVHQRILALRPVIEDGVPHCAIVLDPVLVPTLRRAHRAFQGWRYFAPADAPRDLKKGDMADMPEILRAELTALGLL